ncbi:MAG: chorismate mutase [Patescibacteria group bacterium]
MNELEFLRERINQIDSGLIDLLSDRLWIIKEVAEYKAKNNLPIYQPEREVEVFSRLRALSDQKGLDYAYIEPLFKLIIKNSREIQEGKIKNIV